MPPGYDDAWWDLDAERYEPFGLTLVQTYCYLDEFVDGPIPDDKLALLQRSLDRLRKRGLKALLRFAYEKDMKRQRGPTVGRILGHIDQLAPVIAGNSDVIYVLQAGFIGAWGEWHSSARGIENDHGVMAAVISKILDVLPPDRMTQVRVPKYKRWSLGIEGVRDYEPLTAATAHSRSYAARIGYHNDGFLATRDDGGTWPEPPFYGSPGNPEFDAMTVESPYVPVDGELFWSDQEGHIDGLTAAARMCLQHYSSFSLEHSYSGREGKPYSIDKWMLTPITAEQAKGAGLPVSDAYFEDGGREVARTQFDYITDHLGYRIELQQASMPQTIARGQAADVTIELVNRGFSAFDNPRAVVFVLIRDDHVVLENPLPSADPRAWQPTGIGPDAEPLTHRIHARITIPADVAPGWYQIGLWLPDAASRLRSDPRYAVRVANDGVPWWTDSAGRYGINVLGVVEVTG